MGPKMAAIAGNWHVMAIEATTAEVNDKPQKLIQLLGEKVFKNWHTLRLNKI